MSQQTDLEKIEADRLEHVRLAITEALQSSGLETSLISQEALANAAHAAMRAGDRYPADTKCFPFNHDLRIPPGDMHPSIIRAINEIDAGFRSSDTFDRTDDHIHIAAYVQRWSQELRHRREDDWRNRPDPDDELGEPDI